MVWKILRPHYWILDRAVRRANRALVVAVLAVLAFGGQWVYNNLVRDNLALLGSDQAVAIIASSLPLGLFLLLLFALLGVGDVMHQLYLASDLSLLLVAPVRYRTIFVVKLLQCSRATLLPAVALGVFLLVFGVARGAAVSFYLLVVLLIVAAMAVTTVLIMMLVILLARLLPAQRVRSWMPVAVTLALFALMLCQQPATRWLLGRAGAITFLTEALLDPERLGLVAAGMGGLALVTGLVAYRVFDTSFREGWSRMREVPARRAPGPSVARRGWGVSRLVQPLPQPLRCLLVKEWLELRRNPRGLINLAQPLVLVVAMVLVPVLGGGSESELLQPLLFGFMLVVLAMLVGVSPAGVSLLSVAEEGRRLGLLRVAPISMSDLLRGKFWATWLPLALSSTGVLAIAGVWLGFPLWQTGLLVGVTFWAGAGASAAAVAIGGLGVDFAAEELKQRVSALITYLVIGVNSVFALWTIGGSVWLMVRLFPDSRVVLALRALAGDGTLGRILSDSPWIPLALAGGQALFWVGVGLVWNAAVRRLESWEES